MVQSSLQEKLLVWVLRFGGGVMLLAWLAVFLPTEWMVTSNRWLGIGEFPDGPLVQYLTRSISGLYGIHGGVLLLASLDVRRYRTLVAYIGVTDMLFGALMIGIDTKAGLPLYWTLMEGPPIMGVGFLVLVLLRSVPRD